MAKVYWDSALTLEIKNRISGMRAKNRRAGRNVVSLSAFSYAPWGFASENSF
jgi:hypothetical protein